MTKFVLCCVTSDLSDNLTEIRIVKNSNIQETLSDPYRGRGVSHLNTSGFKFTATNGLTHYAHAGN